MHFYIWNKKYVQYASWTIAIKSRLLLLKIFKVDVLELLWWLALYATIDRSEISNI
jgi:hypothetical protein